MNGLLRWALAPLVMVAGFGSAIAADMPVKARPIPVALFNWTGFYVGAHGGGMWSDKDWTERCSTFPPGTPCVAIDPGGPFRASGGPSSVIGGVQAGYNWQAGKYVIGVEGDWAWSGKENCAPITGNPNGFYQIEVSAACSRIDSFGTFAARFGIALDRVLLYGKAGGAWVHDSYVARCTGLGNCNGFPPGTDLTTRVGNDRVGWMLGVGAEYAFTANWSVKAEYNYIDLGTDTVRLQTVVFAPFINSVHDIDIRQRMSVAKVGVNYRFGGPVVAKF